MKKNLNFYIIFIIVIITLLIVYIALTQKDLYLKENVRITEETILSDNKIIIPNISFPEKIVIVPDFTLKDLDGNDINLSDYRGKIVILNFWASWCPPCKAEMPDFQKAHLELDPDKVVILAINATDGLRETEKKARSFIEENNYTFKVLIDKGQKITSNTFSIRAFPTTMIVLPDGSLYGYREGMVSKEILLMTEELYVK